MGDLWLVNDAVTHRSRQSDHAYARLVMNRRLLEHRFAVGVMGLSTAIAAWDIFTNGPVVTIVLASGLTVFLAFSVFTEREWLTDRVVSPRVTQTTTRSCAMQLLSSEWLPFVRVAIVVTLAMRFALAPGTAFPLDIMIALMVAAVEILMDVLIIRPSTC